MADIENWSDAASLTVKFGQGIRDEISVKSAIMTSEVQCMHCGKTIKTGKLVFCAADNPFYFIYANSRWGEESSKPTFCSSNHARLFAKNNNGL